MLTDSQASRLLSINDQVTAENLDVELYRYQVYAVAKDVADNNSLKLIPYHERY